MKNEFEIFVSAYENGNWNNLTSVITWSKSNQLCIIAQILLEMIEGGLSKLSYICISFYSFCS